MKLDEIEYQSRVTQLARDLYIRWAVRTNEDKLVELALDAFDAAESFVNASEAWKAERYESIESH